jgi:hypothetical protein
VTESDAQPSFHSFDDASSKWGDARGGGIIGTFGGSWPSWRELSSSAAYADIKSLPGLKSAKAGPGASGGSSRSGGGGHALGGGSTEASVLHAASGAALQYQASRKARTDQAGLVVGSARSNDAAESKHQQIHAPQKTKPNLVQEVVNHVSS